jgi:hypothetical protein
MKFILALLLLISTNVNAENRPWTDAEKGLFVANSALIVMDWSQTRYITRHPTFYEANPILGRYPSTQNVDMFFLGQLIGQYYLFDYFDESRLGVMLGLTINRIDIVNHNLNIGVKIRF